MAAPNRRRKAAAKRKEEINSKGPRARAHRFCRARELQRRLPRLALPLAGSRKSVVTCKPKTRRTIRARRSRVILEEGGKKREQKGGRGEEEATRIPRAPRDPFLKFANSPGQLARDGRRPFVEFIRGVPPLSRMFFQ